MKRFGIFFYGKSGPAHAPITITHTIIILTTSGETFWNILFFKQELDQPMKQ